MISGRRSYICTLEAAYGEKGDRCRRGHAEDWNCLFKFWQDVQTLPLFVCTNFAFTSILTHATPAYKAEIITFVHKIKLYVYFEKLSCLLRERERERERVKERSFHCAIPYLCA